MRKSRFSEGQIVVVLKQAQLGSAGQGLESAGPEIGITGPEAVQLPAESHHPDVAVDNIGRRIHVWTNLFPPPAAAEIALRRFEADGNPLEDPRVINTVSDLGQERPRVSVAADGSFLVVWQSIEDDAGLPKKWVRSQAFDSSSRRLRIFRRSSEWGSVQQRT